MTLKELEVLEYMAKNPDMQEYQTVLGLCDDTLELAKAYRKLAGLPPATFKNPWESAEKE